MLSINDVQKQYNELKESIYQNDLSSYEYIKLKIELLKLRLKISLWQIQKQKEIK